MKKITLLLLSLWLTCMAVQAQNRPGDDVKSFTLANGMKILVAEDTSIPNANMYLFWKVGSRNEYPGITGLSHFFEHMMFNGAKKYGRKMFDQVMEANYIGAPGVSRNNPDFVAIEVVNTILGGRFTSWLNDELRVNSGLTYGANSRFNALRHHGTFAISTFTKTATTTEAIDLALEVLNRLHEKGVDAETLSSAKNYVKGQFPPRYETAGQLANLLTAMFVYNFDETYINTFQQKVEDLDVAKVKEIVARYFPKDKLQFVVIGKASEIEDKLSKYGTVIKKEIKAEGF